MQETKSSNDKRPAYGREIAGELGRSLAMPFNGTWRGRYVWWMQGLETVVLGLACWIVWDLTGNAIATGVVFFGIAIAASLVELEARVTERHLERRRAAAARERTAIPDGYVLAYELGNQPGQLGAELADPFLIVAAIKADRWDLYEPLWRFSVRVSSVGGVIVQLPAGSLAGVSALGGFFAELDEGKLGDLTAAERALSARGARDITSVYHQPPAPAG